MSRLPRLSEGCRGTARPRDRAGARRRRDGAARRTGWSIVGGGSIGFGGGGGFGAVRFEGRKGGGEAKVDIKVRGEGRGERIRRGRTGDDVPPRRTKPSRQVEDVVKLPKGGKRPQRHAGDDVKPPKGPKGSTKPPRHAGDDVKPPKGPKGPSKPPRPPQHAEDDDPKPRPRRPRRPVIVLPLPPFGPLAPPVIVREPSARPSQGRPSSPACRPSRHASRRRGDPGSRRWYRRWPISPVRAIARSSSPWTIPSATATPSRSARASRSPSRCSTARRCSR